MFSYAPISGVNGDTICSVGPSGAGAITGARGGCSPSGGEGDKTNPEGSYPII